MELVVWALLVWALSSLTLTTGIGAGVVYAPALALLFGFDLPTAVATSLAVQLAGVGSTAIGHLRGQRTDPALALRLGAVGILGVAVAGAASGVLPRLGSEIAFIIGMGVVGGWLIAGRRLPLPMPMPSSPHRQRELRTGDGAMYPFCRPQHGYGLAALAGAGTRALGISGAEVQISALILRCGIPARAAIGTGTAAAALSLLGAFIFAATGVAWPFAFVGMPAAVAGSLTARRLAARVHPEALRMGIGVLGLISAVGVAIRAVNGV